MLDLHAHTTASDGSLTPNELVAHAREVGLRALGITDHDTIAGWDDAFHAGDLHEIEIVPGVELSIAYERGRFHLLAYYVDPTSDLIGELQEIRMARADRNLEIFENLRRLGLPLEEEDVHRFAGNAGLLGRPHFAQAMVARGYVKTTQEAFDLYLADGKPAFASKAVLTPERAIAAIHEAGGIAIWAHPLRSKRLTRDEIESRLAEWVGWGLDGIEVQYSQYSNEDAEWSAAMQRKYSLLGTGGSDFHGASKPTVRLGVTNTGGPLPMEVLEQLKARRDTIRSAAHG